MRQLCEWKGIEIHEAEVCPDHIHMLVSIPPKIAVSSFMGYLKGKSSVMIYEKFGDLKYKYRNREFWCRGYYVDTVGKNTKAIEEYIRHQLEEDRLGEQMTMLGKGNDNPFTGNWNKPKQVADRICACEGAASILGLCPYMKSHRLGRWMFTLCSADSDRKRKTRSATGLDGTITVRPGKAEDPGYRAAHRFRGRPPSA